MTKEIQNCVVFIIHCISVLTVLEIKDYKNLYCNYACKVYRAVHLFLFICFTVLFYDIRVTAVALSCVTLAPARNCVVWHLGVSWDATQLIHQCTPVFTTLTPVIILNPGSALTPQEHRDVCKIINLCLFYLLYVLRYKK